MNNKRGSDRQANRCAAVILAAMVTPCVPAEDEATQAALDEYREGDFCAAAELMAVTIESGASADPHVAEYKRALHARGIDHNAQRLVCLLHAGVVADDAGSVVKAIASGADVDGHVDAGGTTALIEAARGKHVDFVTRLLANGASVEAADVAGWTPLHYSWRLGPADERIRRFLDY